MQRTREEMRKVYAQWQQSGLSRQAFCKQAISVMRKLLLWEQDGFFLYQKKLERGTYELPQRNEIHQSISSDKWNLILQGISHKSVLQRTRYQHV